VIDHRALRLLAGIALSVAALVPRSALAQVADVRLVGVPFVPQSELLCGGAAAAMVMRFWGAHGVSGDAFADLVDRSAGGIRGSALAGALGERGWRTATFRGDPALVRSRLTLGQPTVVLLGRRGSRFHYVVVVGWSAGRVIYHDPARGPYRAVGEHDFVRDWSKADFWTMVVLPRTGGVARAERPDDDAVPRIDSEPPGPCGQLVDEGVRLAADRSASARRVLERAADRCPEDSAPWRELAGLAAIQRDWPLAASHAKQALDRNPGDAHAERILATGLFLTGDTDGALRAWNELGEPAIDLVDVKGLTRTRYDVAARALRFVPGDVLTEDALRVSRRRLAELPSSMLTHVSYTPGEIADVRVDAVVVERPLVPTGPLSLGMLAARAATDREVTVSVASPSGGGELFSASWRWWEARPRVSIAYAAPSPSTRLGGVWRVEAFSEQQTYGAAADVIERRQRASFSVSDWASGNVRWETTIGADRWDDRGTGVTAAISLERRGLGDRLSFAARAAVWAGEVSTATVTAAGSWTSTRRNGGWVTLARAGVDIAGDSAPLSLWSGAGTGQGREALLRAHPLLDDGIVRDGVFGRALVHGGVEWRRWIQPGARLWRVAPAVFLDAARATRGLPGSDTRTHVDAGVGLRVGLASAGMLRIDVGHGLRDGSNALSIGWTR
jgi:hypothetical protein